MRMIASKFPILDYVYDLFCVNDACNDVNIHALWIVPQRCRPKIFSRDRVLRSRR